VIFHNGQGPMCKDAETFLYTLDHPIEVHLTGEKNFLTLLDRYRIQHPESEGVSDSFEYFPIIFIKGRAFSGFTEEVKETILKEIGR
jgi:hypothetical protein